MFQCCGCRGTHCLRLWATAARRGVGGGVRGDGIALSQWEIWIGKTDLFRVSTNENNSAPGRWSAVSDIQWCMLQQTWRNTIGQHTTHVHIKCWAFLLWSEHQSSSLLSFVRFSYLLIWALSRERLLLLFMCVRLFMLFVRGSLLIVFTKERLFMLFKFTHTLYKS